MADVTFLDVQRLHVDADAPEVALAMTEDEFRAFYDRTSRSLWAYLSRISGDRQQAEDFLQEAYYRLLRANVAFDSESHCRNYLYRVATNLVHDNRRRAKPAIDEAVEPGDLAGRTPETDVETRADVRRAFAHLKPRERAMLWLAYAQGASHAEIGAVLGVKRSSIKLLLFRARRKLAKILEGQGRS